MAALVSVIIPYYHRFEALTASVKSVIQQSYRPIELILINDGGLEFLLPFEVDSEVSIKPINLLYNLGPAAARNAGLESASGTFVAFLDSDDVWIKTKLTNQIYEMERHNLALSHTSYFRRNVETGVEKLINSGSIDYGFVRTAFRCRIATPTVVVRRESIRHIAFDSSVRVGEDILFWLSCCEKTGPSVGLNEPSCVVYVSGGSHFQSEKNKADSLEAVNSLLKRKYPLLAIVHIIYIFFRKIMVKIF